MKKILATLIAVVFLVIGFSQISYAYDRYYRGGNQYQSYRHYNPPPRHHRSHRGHHVKPLEVVGAIAGLVVLDAALNQRQPQRRIQPSYNSGYSGYGHQPSNSPEQERAMQHQMAEERYQNCLSLRDIDLLHDVPPSQAKDCSRLDPRELDWTR